MIRGDFSRVTDLMALEIVSAMVTSADNAQAKKDTF